MRRAGIYERRALGGSVLLPPGAPLASAAGSSARSFMQVFGANALLYTQADLGVTTGASFTWVDQTGNGNSWTQATTGPTTITPDATLNNLQTLRFNGAAMCVSPLTLPAPATTPTYIWMIVKNNTWVINAPILIGQAQTRFVIQNRTATPGINLFNGTNAPVCNDLPIGTWGRVTAKFLDGVNDKLRARAGAYSTGASTNNNATTGRALGSAAGVTWGIFDIYAIGIANRDASTQEETDMDSWITQQCGAGLV